ncbi:MAG: 3-phosphoshikimate 1-carboxyvinyltransferase [Saprospiraceae bacterium]
MKSIQISHPNGILDGEIKLSGSKSISNRALLIRALCNGSFPIHNLSDSDDTVTLENLLMSRADVLDAHHAGTTFRFLTAYLSLKDGDQVLTGSDRMKQRPIKALVDALNYLGANITYLENEGYPPLKISTPRSSWKSEISLPADISSQYISALLMIAPSLPDGLILHLQGEIVSRPYIEMTLDIMSYFGIKSDWEGSTINISHQAYTPRAFFVEADWSAASYYYTMAGLSTQADIRLIGLHADSLQGDADIVNMSQKFGIETTYGDHQIRIIKKENAIAPSVFEYDFIKVPDIAQSISVLCSGLGINGLFTGLQTLRIKETDRISALQTEHQKMNVFISKLPQKFSKKSSIEYYMQEGRAEVIVEKAPSIDTYHDHRMAMAFAPLGLVFPICINDPEVVSKSYPGYWRDLISLGFEISEV